MITIHKHIRQFVHFLITPYYGSNRISRWIRKRIEYRSVQELIGLPLAGLAFFGAVVVPKTQAGFASTELYFDTQKTTVSATVTAARFHWPIATFGISQYFTSDHHGMDLTDPAGTPVRPITDGTIVYAGSTIFGYGKHVVIKHDDIIQSLYAHLSKVNVKTGQTVSQDTEIGSVGATGWATGNHLHLEIFIHGVTTNPLEVLPEIKKQN